MHLGLSQRSLSPITDSVKFTQILAQILLTSLLESHLSTAVVLVEDLLYFDKLLNIDEILNVVHESEAILELIIIVVETKPKNDGVGTREHLRQDLI